MNVKQFRYGNDNLGYLIFAGNRAAVIDGGATERILSFISKRGLMLQTVTNTHSHGDHTCGNADLLSATDAEFISAAELSSRGSLELADSRIEIISTPGHTADSVCLHFPGTLISGDTLFNGKVGRCFTGDIRGFYESIKKLIHLPDNTVVYAGHDYVEEYLEFDRMIEPSNENIDIYLGNYDPAHVRAPLSEEKLVDPFLRLNEPSVISYLKGRNLPAATEYQRWESLVTLM